MAEKKYIVVNGIEHFFVEYIEDESKPVVLYVHGGPAIAESLVGYEMVAATNKQVNWIFYDQRGAGRTYLNNPEVIGHLEDLYNDLWSIVKQLNERFGRKIYIMAHAFGTIMAIRLVRDNPELVAGYIGYGQLIDMVGINKVRIDRVKELAARAGSKRDVKRADKFLAIAGPEMSRDKLTIKQIGKLNMLFSKYNVVAGADKNLMTRMPKSPMYEMSDLRVLMNAAKLGAHLSVEIRDINLYDEPLEYKVPMMFIAGDWDYQCPCTVAADYLEKISAPIKKMSLISDVGSSAMTDSPMEFWTEVLNFLSCI